MTIRHLIPVCIALAACHLTAAVVINEIHYNPADAEGLTEFIEFHNTGTAAVDVGGWYISDGIDFAFPAGTTIGAGRYAVVARDPSAFAAAYPAASNVFGPFLLGSKLKNEGERVALSDTANIVQTEITYAPTKPWPAAADGKGASLELLHPLLPTTAVHCWAASTVSGGTPGAPNSTRVILPAIIDNGADPLSPASGETTYVTAFVLAPTTVVSLTLCWFTNTSSLATVPMPDDGTQQDGLAGDNLYGAAMPAFQGGTVVRYCYRLELAGGMVTEAPPEHVVSLYDGTLTLRLNGNGLFAVVYPTRQWQVASIVSLATSSRLYAYLSKAGETYLDDVSITLGSTQYIANGTFDTGDATWTKAGNHKTTHFEPTNGHDAAGCEHIVATGAGSGASSSLSCYTATNLVNYGPAYRLSFSYRAPTTNWRAWLYYSLGTTNWHVLRINEACAYNTTNVADEDGDYPDWFEIVNTGNTAVNLIGCGITDDAAAPFKWVFPDCVIAPRGHVLVFASDKNRTAPRFHTNFKLGSDGATLILSAPDGSALDATTTGTMLADISYGRLPDGGTAMVYFTAPTPGASNRPPACTGIAEAPAFSRLGGFFMGTLSLTITVQSASAEIRYTTDGTVPRTNSTRYTTPLSLAATTRICARAFETGLVPGPSVRHGYYRGMPTILTSSPLPIVVIDTVGQAIPDEPKITAFMGIISNGPGVRNHVTNAFNLFEGTIGIERRGQSSQNDPQKSYGFETRADNGSERDCSLFGWPAESDWILYAPYNDKAMMRNVLAYQLANEMGRYASRTMFCELVLTGEYRGVYVLEEKIKRAQGRVDITPMHSDDNLEPFVTGGHLFKIDKTDTGDALYYTDEGTRFIQVYPKAADLTAAQTNWMCAYMTAFESVLRSAAFADPLSGYPRYINVPSFIDTFIMVQAFRNIDGLRISSYFHKDRNEKVVSAPAWDYNISLGNANYFDGELTNGWYTGQGEAPFWWARMLEDPNYLAQCRARWTALRKGQLDISNFFATVDAYAATLNEPQRRHFQRWPILGTYVWPNAPGYASRTTYASEVNYLKIWARDRFYWIDSQWLPLIARFRVQPTSIVAGASVQFTDTSFVAPHHWSWSFGDGTVSTTRYPAHVYADAGNFTVTLVVSNYTAQYGWTVDKVAQTNVVAVVPEPAMGLLLAWWITRLMWRRA